MLSEAAVKQKLPEILKSTLNLVAKKNLMREQLTAELAEQGYSAQQVNAALRRLDAVNRQVSDQFIQNVLKRHAYKSNRLLSMKLSQRGISAAAIKQILATLPAEELRAARLASKGYQRFILRGVASPETKVVRLLKSRGFGRQIVKKVGKQIL